MLKLCFDIHGEKIVKLIYLKIATKMRCSFISVSVVLLHATLSANGINVNVNDLPKEGKSCQQGTELINIPFFHTTFF